MLESLFNKVADLKAASILCIVDQDYLRTLIVVGHSKEFKGIWSMASPRNLGYSMEYGGIFITNFSKIKEREKIVRKSKKLRSCQKITKADEQEPSVQSAGRARAVQVQEMHLPKPGNWPLYV